MTRSEFSAIVSDADVLIDYVLSNKKVLYLASTQLFRIYVLTSVLREVKQLSRSEARKLGLIVLEPTLEELAEAMKATSGISFQDKLCLETAKKNNWSCLSNDKRLRRQCEDEGVKTVWGLDLMLHLNKRGILVKHEAEKTARNIHKINLRITEKTIEKFVGKLI